MAIRKMESSFGPGSEWQFRGEPRGARKALSLVLLALCLFRAAKAEQASSISVLVRDENKIILRGVRVRLLYDGKPSSSCETDFSGRCDLQAVPSTVYTLEAQKAGFYVLTAPNISTSKETSLELTLVHQQEVNETVHVTESQNVINPSQTSSTEALTGNQIVEIPYPTTREIKNLLPFIPGVVTDNVGELHVAGSQSYQTLDVLDGFNMTDPVSGFFTLHVSPEAVRSIDVESSRYSVLYGRASGGVLGLYTGMGDDHFRFLATNFLPSYQFKKGFSFDKFVPRASFSGPLKHGQIWFFDAPDAEYATNINRNLPDGADRAPFLRFGNLAKVQANLSKSDILTGSFLLNWQEQRHAYLSLQTPLSATATLDQNSYFPSLKEQHMFANGALFEIGTGWLVNVGHEKPLVTGLPYGIHPEGISGTYFRTSNFDDRRVQTFTNLYLPPFKAWGRHELGMGLDGNNTKYEQYYNRHPINIFREDGTLKEQVLFPFTGTFTEGNYETGAFLQDRWSPIDRLLIESGVRFDFDGIVRQNLISPRVAASYLVGHDTKLSLGVGVFYDATNLSFISRPLEGPRVENFYGPDGSTIVQTTQVRFVSDPRTLQAPRFLNWSASFEQKLRHQIFLRAEYIRKRGEHEFVYVNPTPQNSLASNVDLVLSNNREDHYDAIQTSLRQTFKDNYFWMVAFTHSSARSNAVVGFSVDSIYDPIFLSQNAGPLPWDTPNRLLAYGFLPGIKSFDFAYTVEWRTGFPFNVVNQQQQIVGAPDSRRFLAYFNFSPYVEKRFELFKVHWAVRGGFDNVTSHRNAQLVNNNIDSPDFLTFSQFDRRTFVGRIRFLGKSK
jgi:hypothetical protein